MGDISDAAYERRALGSNMAFLLNRAKYPAAAALGAKGNICDIYTEIVTCNIFLLGAQNAHVR
jgi:hypothetical protein